MATNWNNPVTTSLYTDVISLFKDRDEELALGFDPATVTSYPTNLPTNAIRWNSANSYWEKYGGASWAALDTLYNINVTSLSGLSSTAFLRLAGGGNQTISSGNVIISAGSLDVRKNGTAQDILTLRSDLGVQDRSMVIRSPSTDSATAAFVFFTNNSFEFLVDATTLLTVGVSGGTTCAFGGHLSVPFSSRLYLDGGSDTYIRSNVANQIIFVRGGSTALTLTANAVFTGTVSGTQIQVSGTNIFNKIYPVGSIYINYNVATNPNTLFGIGSWSPLENRFLIGESTSYGIGSEGGSTAAALPQHTHSGATHTHSMSHTHSIAHTHGLPRAISTTNNPWLGFNSGSAIVDYGNTSAGASPANSGNASSNTTGGSNSGNTGGASAGNTGNAGTANTANANMPPYRAVYMWRRVS